MKDLESFAVDLRIRVHDSDNTVGYAGRQDGVDTWCCAAMVRTGFQRHIERGAVRAVTGGGDGLDLGMLSADRLGPPAAGNALVVDDDGPDGWIGSGAPEGIVPQFERLTHVVNVVLLL